MLSKCFSALLALVLVFTLATAALASGALEPSEDFYVNDQAGTLSESTKELILNASGPLEQECDGAQIVVVTINYLPGGYDSEQYAWQLFNDCIEAAEALNEDQPGSVEAEKISTWEKFRDGLKPIEIGDSGQIKEWYDEKTWAIEEDPALAETVTDWDAYAEEEGWMRVDLSYFFEGSLSEGEDAIFYTTEIQPVTGKNLKGEDETVYVGRQFLAQYPTIGLPDNLDIIPGLAVMEDYGNNNEYVLRMWENVKASGVLEPWIIVLFCLEIVLAIGIASYFIVRKQLSLHERKKRRAAK